MDFETEIDNYISSEEHNGALLVTGKWGCGKTFVLKRIRDSHNKNGDAVIAMVSLFGIDSTELLAKKVKETVFFAQTSKTKEKNQRTIRRLKQNITPVLSAFQEYSNIIKGINAALSINFYDWVSVEKEVVQYSKDLKKNDPIKRPLVLVFDDLERCGIDIKDLLGSINEYAENREIKTIIVADENKIGDEKYTEFKEKVICRTIKLSPNSSDVIASIISNYKESKTEYEQEESETGSKHEESETGYKQFLTDNKDVIDTVFNESQYENLRFAKTMMIDFERVYNAWEKSKITMKKIRQTFYEFCVITAEHRAGNYIKSIKSTYNPNASEAFKANNENIYASSDEEAIKQKYSTGTFDNIPISLSKWVVEGEWDETLFVAELQKLYNKSEQSAGEKILKSPIWSLNQKIIEEGFPIVLKKAYNGDLSCEELLELFEQVHIFNQTGVTLPCEIDYQHIEKSFDERAQKIRDGIIQEPERHLMVHDKQIDNEAIPIKNKIERLDDKKEIQNNYKEFLSYLKGDNQISIFKLRNATIDVFDENLLNFYIQKYKESENEMKRDLGQTLIDVSIYSKNYSSKEEIDISLKNLNRLIEQLKTLSKEEEDQIARLLTEALVQRLEEKAEKITPPLHPHEPQEAL